MSDLKGKCIGFDLGGRNLHIAVRNRKRPGRIVVTETPEGLVRDGQILSWQAMSDFLKDLRKQEKLRVRDVSLVLPQQVCYFRRFTTVYMTAEQLKFNLPYEFRDYITSGKDEYNYDYSVVETVRDETGAPKELDLLAGAVRKDLMAEYNAMFHRAGFRLRTAVPVEMAYINLIRAAGQESHGHCILDLGHTGIRLYMFAGDHYESVRALDYGCAEVQDAVADHFGVDPHLAETYLKEDYEKAATLPACQDIYGSIATEVLKAVNFYRFNNQGKELTHIHCCGGGAKNAVLLKTLRDALPLPVEDIGEFWGEKDMPERAPLAAAAVGATMQ